MVDKRILYASYCIHRTQKLFFERKCVYFICYKHCPLVVTCKLFMQNRFSTIIARSILPKQYLILLTIQLSNTNFEFVFYHMIE